MPFPCRDRRSGLGMLAARLNVPMLPLRIGGLYEMNITGRKIARPGELRIVIGSQCRSHLAPRRRKSRTEWKTSPGRSEHLEPEEPTRFQRQL
jgi:1-acyl-sn-glycerol-3-phosphate acyltransferase